MGRQNEKFARMTRVEPSLQFCDAKYYRGAKRLDRYADFLRCDLVDAAMHNHRRGQLGKMESIIDSNERNVDSLKDAPDAAILCATAFTKN